MCPSEVSTVASRIVGIRASIAQACERAGRDPEDVTLIGVTKTFTVESVAEGMAAGLADFGENRAQELLPKVEEAAGRGLLTLDPTINVQDWLRESPGASTAVAQRYAQALLDAGVPAARAG